MRTIDRSVVDDATVASFRTDGCCVVRRLFDADEVDLVRTGIERNLAEPGPLFGVASRDDDPGRFVEDFCNWQRIDEYRRIAFDSRAADAAGTLMDSSQVRLFHDHMLVKEPGTRQPTPWHQDQPYYNVDRIQNISMWMPVDPVAPESTLEFLAGSHLGGWLMPRTFLTEQARWFPEGSLAEIPDIESDRESYDIRGWALEPGDAVFFHMLTAHHAYGVPGTNGRRAFSLRFLGDDAMHAPRPWRTSPQFDGLESELPAGAPMGHPLLPVVRVHLGPQHLPSHVLWPPRHLGDKGHNVSRSTFLGTTPSGEFAYVSPSTTPTDPRNSRPSGRRASSGVPSTLHRPDRARDGPPSAGSPPVAAAGPRPGGLSADRYRQVRRFATVTLTSVHRNRASGRSGGDRGRPRVSRRRLAGCRSFPAPRTRSDTLHRLRTTCRDRQGAGDGVRSLHARVLDRERADVAVWSTVQGLGGRQGPKPDGGGGGGGGIRFSCSPP